METKLMLVTSSKATDETKRPKIHLSGLWLNTIGFEIGKMFSVEYEFGSILFKLQPDNNKDTYISLVKEIRKNKSGQILQVYGCFANKIKVPFIDLLGFWLNQYGFKIGSIFALNYQYGLLDIKLLDIEKLKVSNNIRAEI